MRSIKPMPIVNFRRFSAPGIDTSKAEKILLNKMLYEDEIQLVLIKLEAAIKQIKDDPDTTQRITNDVKELKTKLETIIFWELHQSDDQKPSEEEAASYEFMQKQEKVRELQLKKLMTIAKSKFYMLKVNYPAIFDKVEADSIQGRESFEPRMSQEDKFAEAQTDSADEFESLSEHERVKQEILKNLKKPVKNLDEEFEDLDSPE